MRRLERRNKKCIKESNAAEWRAIEDQAHSEAMTHFEDRNDDSQPSSIGFNREEDLRDPKIQKFVDKYLRIIKKRRTTRLEKLFGSWKKENFYNQIF